MAKQINLPAITNKIYELLNEIPAEDRQKVIKAAFVLLGDSINLTEQKLDSSDDLEPRKDIKKPKDFFESKDPQTKIEEIAVACRFRELTLNNHIHTKEEIAKVFDEARRNFDIKNFKRDLDNAKKKGLINKGREIKLSYIGQEYIDMLPDREKLKTIRKPRKPKAKSQNSSQRKK